MRCFLVCFNASPTNKNHSIHNDDGINKATQLQVAIQQEEPIVIKPIILSKEKLEEKVNSNEKKKVKFDLDAKVYEAEKGIDNGVIVAEKKENVKEEEEILNESKSMVVLVSTNGPTNPAATYRYQNYSSDIDDDCCENVSGDNRLSIQEESSESLFSLSIDSRKYLHESEVGDKEVSSPIPKSVLCQEEVSAFDPLENPNQRKPIKARADSTKQHQDKENINVEQDSDLNYSSKANSDKMRCSKQEIAVDTSLSSWLVDSATKPSSKDNADSVENPPSQMTISPRRHEDRAVLGELSLNKLNADSKSLSCKKESKTPKTPVVGTIGSYWSLTGYPMDSDSGSSSNKGMQNTKENDMEDELRKWNSTPFQAMLDLVEQN